MAQLFNPAASWLTRGACVGALLGLTVLCVGAYAFVRSAYATGVGRAVEQPVPFSHAHHVGGLGIDCRYCHQDVARSSSAGMPSSSTCMNCHKELWTQTAALAPVRESWRTGQPVRWTRVHDLPDHVYFDHSIHVVNGVGCATCHGRVDRMPRTWKAETLLMQWCLDCHRDPGPRLRPPEAIFDLDWQPPQGARERAALGRRLLEAYDVRTERLTDCSRCHR